MGLSPGLVVAGAVSLLCQIASPAVAADTPARASASAKIEVAAKPRSSVRAVVQSRPGGPVEEVDMAVHEVPVDPETVAADEIDLSDDELVLGLVIDGQAIAYPIRYLALFELINDRVGKTAITPTW